MHPLIQSDPAIMMDKPVIRGTRITVEHILREFADGNTIAHLLDNYPHLSDDDIRAALAFASDHMADEIIAYKTVAAE